jgi:hypothetical protein
VSGHIGQPIRLFGVTTPQNRAWRLHPKYEELAAPTQWRPVLRRRISLKRRVQRSGDAFARMGLRAIGLGCMIAAFAKGPEMGGLGSGARRSAHVGNVEDVLRLDIRRLRRLGVVRAGECVIDDIHWSIDGLSTPCVRLRVDLSDIERGGVVIITGDMPDGPIRQRVAIDAVLSRFGGWRCYFLCPATAMRCEVLHYLDGRFGSRTAQRLSYAVQGMNELSRARRRSAKLRQRLCGSGSMPRARGANRIEIVKRLREAEYEARSLHMDRLRRLVD